jgi:eukaryotic-like serine/threonine-protein kinase
MVPSKSYELAEALRRADLLTPSQILKLASELLPSLSEDPQELAFALVQRGWLTSYQAEQVLLGNAQQLVLGGYRLLAPLGSGGMGLVYKAWQKKLNRTVALKVIRPELMNQNRAAAERFRREALAVAQLSHPNIVSIYDADEVGDTHFIVLEFVDGPDLERLVQEGGPLPVALACEYVRQAALGLQHAYEAGLVHRDIKPSNLLISRPESARRGGDGAGWNEWGTSFSRGLVKILDMGLARMESMLESKASLTREGAMMGTPDYVAPEQAVDASSVDIRADLYSLGGTFYYLLTGQLPFPGGTVIEKLLKHQQSEPVPIEETRSDVPEEIRLVVRRLMAKSPLQRFQTPIELVLALEQILRPQEAVKVPNMVPAGAPALSAFPVEPPTANRSSSTPSSISSHRTAGSGAETPPDSHSNPVSIVTSQSLQTMDPLDHRMLHEMIPAAYKSTVLRGHKGPVMGLAFSPDSKMLATGGVDAIVHIWSLGSGARDLAILEERRMGDIQVLAFAPGGEYLVTGSASLDARMWKWNWRESRDRDHIPLEGPSFSDALAFSADGQNLVSAVGTEIVLWSVGEGAPRKRSGMHNQNGDIKSLQFSPDSKQLASGDTAGVVQIWKLGWRGGRAGQAFAGHRSNVISLSFSQDNQFLASASLDQTVRIWDASGNNKRSVATLKGIKGVVKQMLFLPDPQMILTACDGGQVILWNWSTGHRQHEWRLDQPIICSLAMAGDGCLVAAGSSDGTATVYDLVPDSN